jgi:nicotinate phosphoribosyltransferase
MNISSFLADKADTDVYLLFMGQIIRKRFPKIKVEYDFIHRSNEPFPENFGDDLQKLVNQMSSLTVSSQTVQYLHRQHPYLSLEFLEWWENNFHFDPKQVRISQEGTQLFIHISGLWSETIYWETPLLAVISGLYNVMMKREPLQNWQEDFEQNIKFLRSEIVKDHLQLKVSEFGTRRRFGLQEHAAVLKILQTHLKENFVGTSNLHFAEVLHTRPIGTIAHQFIMAMSALYGVQNANLKTLRIWHEEYQNNLQTALTDTFTHELFFKTVGDEFQSYKVFRHDSGNPNEYILLLSEFLKKHQLKVSDYTILFSDALAIDQIIDLSLKCQEAGIQSAFGVGNSFTHFATGVPALDIVIKPTAFVLENGERVPVTKLANDIRKTSGSSVQDVRAEVTALLQE